MMNTPQQKGTSYQEAFFTDLLQELKTYVAITRVACGDPWDIWSPRVLPVKALPIQVVLIGKVNNVGGEERPLFKSSGQY